VTTIAIVDDDISVREGASLVLDNGERAISTFASGDEFLEAGAADWSIVFLDLKMPGRTGFDVLKELRDEQGTIAFPVVMISAHGDVAAAVQAMRLGAFGFVEKPFTPEMLEEAIAEIETADQQIKEQREALLSALTPREREVAEHLNEGLSNKEVALKLACSPRTVEIHRARIFKKLSVRNVAGLVRRLSQA